MAETLIFPEKSHGRFAPTPTGPLHAGSLLAAVASYLDARHSGGRWSVRIEDIDPPRCPPGADTIILQQLETYGLYWDGDVSYQHDRGEAYTNALEVLIEQNLAYPCSCSRKEWRQHAVYPGWCREGVRRPDAPKAWRLRTDRCMHPVSWHDRVYGHQTFHPEHLGDVVIKRKDSLWAYQIAVVVDDAEQGITDVVRGADLLDNTLWQIQLQQALGLPTPRYLHLPLVMGDDGQKLSKQNLAQPLPHEPDQIRALLHQTLRALGQDPVPELAHATVDEQLAEALAHWNPGAIRPGAIRSGEVHA